MPQAFLHSLLFWEFSQFGELAPLPSRGPLGQLTRVNDEYASETWTYEYDQGGNLLAMKRYAYTAETLGTVLQTVPYTYGNPNWKDQLTAYDGKAITYDAIGSPLTYDGWAYTWKAGRMLERMLKLDMEAMTRKEVTFTYDHTGLRVKKSVNGTDTLYTLNGKKITHVRKQVNGENVVRMHFFYDAQGRPSIIRYNDVDYVYVHNLQGDVIAIVDMDGNKVVEYGYDAWGRPTGKTGVLAGTLGADNPFRYRGYVWDEETGLYYLRSRYYNPEWGRFLNADVLLGQSGKLFGHNLFVYCRNSPILNQDPNGFDSIAAPWEGYINDAREAAKSSPALLGLLSNPVTAGVTAFCITLFWPTSTATDAQEMEGMDTTFDTGSTAITGQAQTLTISNVQTTSIAQSTTQTRTYRPPLVEVHHIVAQTAPAAGPARQVLISNGIGINDPDNLVPLPYAIHRLTHTNAYYGYVNACIIAASRKNNPFTVQFNVRMELLKLKTMLSTMGVMSMH